MKQNSKKRGALVTNDTAVTFSPMTAYAAAIMKKDRKWLQKVVDGRIVELAEYALAKLEVVRECLEEAKANPARLYDVLRHGSVYETREEATTAILAHVFVFGNALQELGAEIEAARIARDKEVAQMKHESGGKAVVK